MERNVENRGRKLRNGGPAAGGAPLDCVRVHSSVANSADSGEEYKVC